LQGFSAGQDLSVAGGDRFGPHDLPSLIALHGGTLCVDSALGKGTMFTVTIPRRQNAAVSTDTERLELPTMTPASPVVR
jgi:hypothetical protein